MFNSFSSSISFLEAFTLLDTSWPCEKSRWRSLNVKFSGAPGKSASWLERKQKVFFIILLYKILKHNNSWWHVMTAYLTTAKESLFLFWKILFLTHTFNSDIVLSLKRNLWLDHLLHVKINGNAGQFSTWMAGIN